MSYFWDTQEIIPSGVGFQHYDAVHLGWLMVLVLATLVNCIWYGKMQERGRRNWEKTIAFLLLADELIKAFSLLAQGLFIAKYLPFHLCSINIFVIGIHAWKKSDVLDNFLYTVCIPGTLAAMLFPNWTELPLGNLMHIHSFTVHILLIMYPVVLTVNGVIRPKARGIPKCLLLLVLMAGLALVVNLLLDTNFMFLMYATEGNPLYIFQNMWGSHLWGFPVIIAGVLMVLYIPLELWRNRKKYKKIQ